MRVYGIASQDDPKALRNFASSFGITFPILVDENESVHKQWTQNSAFPTAAYPQDWIVGPTGQILYANNGFEPDEMRFVLDRALED